MTRSFGHIVAGLERARVALGACLLLVLTLLVGMSPATAAEAPGGATAPVVLGSAAGYSVLAGASIANTGPGTVLALDLGVGGTLAGFPPGTVTGDTHIADSAVEAAQTDRQTAYDGVVAQTGGTPFGGDLAGKTFAPGLYSTAAAVTNTGTITLDAGGDPNAVFIFQVGAALSSAAATKVVLANGALANNVYWQAVGAVSLGANVKWVGTLLGNGVVAFGDGASLKGRLLTPGTVTLANSPITKPIDDLVAPVVSVDGGPTRSTKDTTPSVSGTTDEPGTPLVTVTIGSQVLTTHAAAGAWTVSTDALTSGPHNVVASVTDPSGNTGTASQVLTVDTVAPEVTITGGATVATNDTTPTISGTTDEPGTPTVTVTVGGQTLTTTAGSDGAWSVDAAALSETSHSVRASVDDAAGNTGAVDQILTVDVTVPVLTIDGGAARSTSDTSPWTYGTTAEQAGTIVNVSVGGQALTATVQPGGTWGVSAETLAPGPYTVLASITDAADNTGTMTQSLQVGTVVTPVVTIGGGGTRATSDTTPTISGTTGEPGTPTVTVTVGAQTLTATAHSGLWSVGAATLAEGPHTATASVTARGLTGSASQVLTVDTTTPVVTIDGGATRSTTDTTPWTRGTSTEPAGTVVHVNVGDQQLNATVGSGGAWGVSADTLANGHYSVVASITDVAGNVGTSTQALTIGPTMAPTYRPDGEIRKGTGAYVGKGAYTVSRQRVTTNLKGHPAKTTTFGVRFTNRGNVAEQMTLRGTASGGGFAVAYLSGRTSVTAAVLKGSYRSGTLKPGQSATLTVRVTKVSGAKIGSHRTFTIRTTSVHDHTKTDAVAAVVKVVRG